MFKRLTALLLAAVMLLMTVPALADEETYMSALFSLQTNLENPEPLENVEKRRIDVPYINKDGEVTSRPILAYIPTDAEQPMPCVYVPHYAMEENAAELRRYLAKGWAVIAPTDFDTAYNASLTDDDLVFNNAALYTVRHMPEIDPERIALIGGSAGGYMTLMLYSLQMGSCCAVATAPIANVYFNFHKYFPAAKEINDPAFLQMLLNLGNAANTEQTENENGEAAEVDPVVAFLSLFMDNYPLPFLAMVEDNFIPINENFPDPDDISRWEAFSAVGLTDCFSSPLVIVHCTSDILVPVDQITREFTYPTEGETMPEGFSTRLDASYPGKLGHSLAEELPEELVSAERFVSSDYTDDMDLPYRKDVLVSIDIFDDGPTQSYGSHSAATNSAAIIDTGFAEEMFALGLLGTERLMPGKLLLLLNRYLGKSVQLPAHEGIDDTVYGSLVIYRQEVVEELARWANDHSIAELDTAVLDAIATVEDADEAAELTAAWNEIKGQM